MKLHDILREGMEGASLTPAADDFAENHDPQELSPEEVANMGITNQIFDSGFKQGVEAILTVIENMDIDVERTDSDNE